MKLRNIFVSDTLGDEKILVSTNDNIFNGLIRTNEAASFIIDCLYVDTTVDEIVDKVIKRYDVTKQKASYNSTRYDYSCRGTLLSFSTIL